MNGGMRNLLWLRRKLSKKPATNDPIQHATCTEGPSLPTESPEAMTSGYRRSWTYTKHKDRIWLTSVILLIKKVAKPRNPCITKPARIHLISEMPEPAAYLARDRTRWEATNEKPHCISEVNANRTQRQQLSIWSEITHGKQHEDHPACQCYMTPGMPWITAIYFFSFYFPTTELLV